MISISMGNTKLGSKIANISLPPGSTCRKGAPCRRACYALKAWKQYQLTRNAWTRNLRAYRRDPGNYFREISHWLDRHKTIRFFRWHVAGDIPDLRYYVRMKRIARKYPQVKFLVFTKQYDFVSGADIPENLTVVFSSWPGLELSNPAGLPVAWMQDGTETRVPEDARECPGRCDQCGMCWSLNRGESVVFHRH